jgi:hypothetical protein
MTSTAVRAWAMLVATIALVAPTAVWATPQQQQRALPAVRLSKIQFDPPGADELVNSSLNKEWVQVHNFGARSRSLGGWSIRDRTGFRFRFPAGFRIGPGVTVTIHTGTGANRPQHQYWGQGSYIWNNTGDKATFKNAAGTVVDTCTYDGTGSSVIC